MCLPLGVYPPAGSILCVLSTGSLPPSWFNLVCAFHWEFTSQLVQSLCVFPLGVYLPAGSSLCVCVCVCVFPLGVYLPAGSSIKCLEGHPNVPVRHSNLLSGRAKETLKASIRPSTARHQWSRLSHCHEQQTRLRLLLTSDMRLLRQIRSKTRGDNSVVQRCPISANIPRQWIQAKAATEVSGPAKGIRTPSAGSPINPDPAKRTKTGPPHHVFDFRFAKPAKSRPTTFDRLSKPKASFCAAKINSHGEDIFACLFLPYARFGDGRLPGPGAYSTECIGPLVQEENKNQLVTGRCLYWSAFGSFLGHYLASWTPVTAYWSGFGPFLSHCLASWL